MLHVGVACVCIPDQGKPPGVWQSEAHVGQNPSMSVVAEGGQRGTSGQSPMSDKAGVRHILLYVVVTTREKPPKGVAKKGRGKDPESCSYLNGTGIGPQCGPKREEVSIRGASFFWSYEN